MSLDDRSNFNVPTQISAVPIQIYVQIHVQIHALRSHSKELQVEFC